MPSLQIRSLPDDVYQALAFRAEQAHRSLAQQAVIELRGAVDSGSAERRRRVLRKLRARLSEASPNRLPLSPERLVREDRER
jgi:plasmid stability protein